MKPTKCLLSAGLLLGACALPSLAQTPPPMMPPAPGAMAMMPLPAMDQLFMIRAAEGNMAEVAEAQIALQKSKNPGVKMVAQTIIRGHSQAQVQLQAAAARKGVSLPTMVSPTHMATSQALKKAKGDNFDKMYISHQLDDHENTVALFANEISMGQDPDAQALARTQLPDILGHTMMIYNVARQIQAPGIEFRPVMPPAPPGITPTPMADMMAMPGMTPPPGGMAPMPGMPPAPGMAPMPGMNR